MSEAKPTILLLSTSSEIAESVQSILSGDYNVIRAKTLTQSFEILDTKRAPIAILDFAAATSLNGDTLNQLKQHKPELVTLLVCPREKRDALLESNLSNQTYRVLFASLSPGQTRLAVAAAIKHAKAKASEMPKTKNTEQSTKDVIKATKNRPNSQSKRSSSKLIPIIAGVGLIALAGISWMFMSGEKDAESSLKVQVAKVSEPETTEIKTASPQIETTVLSTQAKASFDSGILFPPEENNALDSYIKILQLDPNDFAAKKALIELSQAALGDVDLHIENGSIEEAKNSIEFARNLGKDKPMFLELIENSIIEKKSKLITSTEESLNSGSVSEAANLIALADGLFSGDEQISSLKATINEQQKSLNKTSQINTLISQSRNSINANRLLAPNRNNALFYINRLETLDSSNSAITELKRNLSSSLLLEARTSALDSNFTNAKRYVDSAETLGASSASISSERQRINSLEAKLLEQKLLQEQAEEEIEAARLIAETQKLAQEQADAQAAADKKAEEDKQAEMQRLSSVPVDVLISDLTRLKNVAPVYPANYQRRNIEGSATMAFTLQKDGSMSKLRVVSVAPESRKLFGEAAKKAMEQWEFEPYKDANGNTRIANIQVRINFSL